jgi:2-hydroxychromene-2-carboxylate isomerase
VIDPPIEFFFDFMSPFAYLAHGRLCDIADRRERVIAYQPIDLRAAKLAAGNTGPANREIPAKLSYLLRDIERWAERYGLPVRFPASLDSARMNTGTFYALERGKDRDYVSAGFDLGWGQGADISSDETLAALAERLHWPVVDFLDYVADPKQHKGYQTANSEAHRRGVFGVPTMLIGEEMWWGNDRLEFLEDYCQAAVTWSEPA